MKWHKSRAEKKTKQNKARVQWKRTIDLVQTKKCIAIASRGNPKEISLQKRKKLQRISNKSQNKWKATVKISHCCCFYPMCICCVRILRRFLPAFGLVSIWIPAGKHFSLALVLIAFGSKNNHKYSILVIYLVFSFRMFLHLPTEEKRQQLRLMAKIYIYRSHKDKLIESFETEHFLLVRFKSTAIECIKPCWTLKRRESVYKLCLNFEAM